MANTFRAGRIAGDPTRGLCERICIEAARVFDGCRETVNNQNYVLELNGIPPQAVAPFTFIEAVNYGETLIENVSVVSLDSGKSRVSGDIIIPVIVTFTDSLSNAYTAASTIRFHRDFVLNIPNRSIVPYKLEVFAAFISRIGNFIGENAVSVSGCYTLVVKVIVMTDILVPIYGNCVYPDCVECGRGVCNEFTSLPLFPDV